MWLALLNEDPRSAGTLGAILIRADAIAIQRYFNDYINKGMGGRSGRANRISTFVDTTPDSVAERERLIGVEFLRWLTMALESGKIVINRSPLFWVPGGFLMCAEIFILFIRENPEYKNWQAAQKAFLSLGMHSVGTDGEVISRFEQTNTQHMESGIVLSDYAVVLPEEAQVYNLNTGKISTMSAIELVQLSQNNHQFHRKEPGVTPNGLQYLAASGQWQAGEQTRMNLKSGKSNRG